jgi:type IV pilus biogenesis protein CpaD/CtpE
MKPNRPPRATFLTLALPALLGGCNALDPQLSDRDWHPNGANELNIAAQVVNPADLVYGRVPTNDADAELAAAAVLRLRAGHVKPLPDSSISDLHVQAAPAPAAAP